jgi:hypothetical protein
MPNIPANQSFAGSDITDTEILQRLPEDFRQLLTQVNGCVLFDGGFHVRGAVVSPEWHSLRKAWIGESSLHRLFPAVEEADVPFGQDCFGDQFLLRSGIVHQLQAEIGELESVDMDLETFLNSVQEKPVDFLSLQSLQRFRDEGGELKPGELLSVYPPFCTKETARGVSLKAIPALERISFLADFAKQIAGLQEGTKMKMKPVE